MKFKGKFEAITETTLGRFQQGGIMVGDIVKIKKKALSHPKVKEMADNLKGNIKLMMDTDLHLTVTGLRSTRDSRGEMSDGLGLASTTAPTDFWVDVCVLHSPGLKSDPVTLPIEVLERMDFGASLPPVPDSLVRKGKINIKPEPADKYVNRIGEDIEDIYSNMQQPPTEPEQVTVRVPLEDSEDTKVIMDQHGVTYSVIGPDRYELHGTMDAIQSALNATATNPEGEDIDIEYVEGEGEFDPTTQIPNTNGLGGEGPELGEDPVDDSLEEAYNTIMGGMPKAGNYTISIPNAFADNVTHYLNQEGVSNSTTVEGNLTLINVTVTADKEGIEEAIRTHVMGDLTYLKVYKSDQYLN